MGCEGQRDRGRDWDGEATREEQEKTPAAMTLRALCERHTDMQDWSLGRSACG